MWITRPAKLYEQYALNFGIMQHSLRELLDNSLLSLVRRYDPLFANSDVSLMKALSFFSFFCFFLLRESRLIRTRLASGILITREQYIHA